MATATEAPATMAEGPTSNTQNQLEALEKMRVPFDPSQVSKLPKIWCGKCSKSQYKVCDDHKRERCNVCAGNMTSAHLHLDYVGHAELTGRLLEVDPLWTWEPMAFDQDGLPKFDQFGGLWIRLTVAGHTRLGYGDAQGKTGPNAVKEAIGDALRNAAMRFGAALALWSKTDMDVAAAQKKSMTVEPSREDRLEDLYRLMQQRWGHLEGLRAVKVQVGEELFHESQVHDQAGKIRLFGELIDERIRELLDAKKKPKGDAGQAPAPTAAAPEQSPARPDPIDQLMVQVQRNWDDQVGLTSDFAEATRRCVLTRDVQNPVGAWLQFGHMVTARIAELKQQAQAAGQDQHDRDRDRSAA